MKAIGIIGEFNPFHNGHLYFINQIKNKYPDYIIILVLNGYFLERGEISYLTKQTKTRLSLNYGIDLIFELPFVYGTQSADYFANASLKILNELKVEKIVFGSEENNLNLLKEIAKEEIINPEYNLIVKDYLNKGANYPTALAKAIKTDFSFQPNDLLGISYLKSIINNNYKIEPILIKRTNRYHDLKSNNKIISASNIRSKIDHHEDISKYIPYDKDLLININYDKLFALIKFKILTDKDLSIYLDVDEGIENRLLKIINNVNNYQDLVNKVKTKRYTFNKINRMFIHILIDFTKEDNKIIKLNYNHLLGFSLKGKEYLNKIKKEINLTIDKNSLIYEYELKASLIYDLINNTNTYKDELTNKPFKL